MTTLIELEKKAAALRRHLKRAQFPELKLLCILKFFRLLSTVNIQHQESYIREFQKKLYDAAINSNPSEFLPDEVESLDIVRQYFDKYDGDLDLSELRNSFDTLFDNFRKSNDQKIAEEQNKDFVRFKCVFVEYYPDLELSPRGRLLNLNIKASRISSKIEEDEIFIQNPTSKPDDEFQSQAKDSVIAARKYLNQRYKLSLSTRYRFDISVGVTGARLTGNSLGIAIAVGAIAAHAKTDVLCERMTISEGAVFSGALLPDGKLAPVDSEALKLKIYRAYHSEARCLVIPTAHLTDAETLTGQLEERRPDRELILIGADSLENVLDNPKLFQRRSVTLTTYIARRTVKASRSVAVQIPALIILAALLYAVICIQYPKAWLLFDDNPKFVKLTKVGFEALNKDFVFLWDADYECDSLTSESQSAVGDLDLDGKNEVVFTPRSSAYAICENRAYFYCYNHEGELLFRKSAAILGEYPGDTSETQNYPSGSLKILKSRDHPIIVSILGQSMPSRSHIKLWDISGNLIGWYINAGSTDTQPIYIKDVGYLFIGLNNRYGRGCIFVIPVDSASGASPPYSSRNIDLSWVKRGNQIHYILFPTTDYCEYYGCQYNLPLRMELLNDSLLRVEVSPGKFGDERQDPLTRYYININNGFRVIDVDFDDEFVRLRRLLVKRGELPAIDWGNYRNELINSVAYWKDTGFVN